MNLTLRPEEAALIARVLTSHLADLRAEISNTENYDLRQSLKQEEETIKSLLARLGQEFGGI